MHLFIVGLSHKTAPLDIRERLAFAPQDTGAVLLRLHAGR